MSETSKQRKTLYKGEYGIFHEELRKIMADDFRNTPLSPYVKDIVLFFVIDFWSELLSYPAKTAKKGLIKELSEAIDYAKFLKFLKEGKIKGPGWQFSNTSVRVSIYDCTEQRFLDHLDYISEVFDDSRICSIEENGTVDIWEKLFADLPCRECLEFEDKIYCEKDDDDDDEEPEVEYQRLSLRELTWLIKELTHYKNIAENLLLNQDRPFIHRLIEFLLDAGMPKSRPVYDQLYRALDYWGLIPDDVKHRHECGEPYNDSNYIKSYVSTITRHKKQQKKYYDGL